MIFIVILCARFFTYPSHYEKTGGMQFANLLCYGMNVLWSREVEVQKYKKCIKRINCRFYCMSSDNMSSFVYGSSSFKNSTICCEHSHFIAKILCSVY
jgi:hypothetical protein